MAFVSPLIDISLISVALVVASKFLQSKLVDKDRQKAAQQRMKDKQKRIKELMGKQDEKSKREVAKLQKELFEEMGESMQGTMRYMMFSLPLFFGAFFLLGMFYGGLTFETPFPVPKFEGFFLLNPLSWIPVGWSLTTGWLKWYFITYLITLIILSIVLKVLKKMKGQNKEKQGVVNGKEK